MKGLKTPQDLVMLTQKYNFLRKNLMVHEISASSSHLGIYLSFL